MLLLLPNLLGDHRHYELFLPTSVAKAVGRLDGLIAESEKEGRRFLSRFDTKKPTQEIPLTLFNEHTPEDHLDFILEPLLKGECWGIVSDAGLPCVADPGSKLVWRARQKGIPIQAFIGPSAILLGLMLSGLPGQQFAFQGYLNKDPKKRQTEIQELGRLSKQKNATQIVIEAPYRNQHTLQALIESLPEQALLCAAWDLTLPSQGIMSQTVQQWKKTTKPNLEKKPTIFLFYVGSDTE